SRQRRSVGSHATLDPHSPVSLAEGATLGGIQVIWWRLVAARGLDDVKGVDYKTPEKWGGCDERCVGSAIPRRPCRQPAASAGIAAGAGGAPGRPALG